MSVDTKILLLGFGNMGRALAAGWLARGHRAEHIAIVDPQPDAQAAARALGLQAASGSAPQADVVVVAVKPAHVAAALAPLAATAPARDAVYLSIVAGKTTTQLATLLGGRAAVVRAMPNTPAAIGRGITGMFANVSVSAVQRDLCGELMGAVGAVEWLADEALIDVVTAVSGSGPAYVFLLIECLTAAGTELGLSRDAAERLATATVAGAGAYASVADEDAAALRRRVTSPQGTTQAALDVLQANGGMAELIGQAVRAAAARSRALSAD